MGSEMCIRDRDETGTGDRRRCLALRLPIRSRGLGRSLGVAQGHSPRPVRPVSLARPSRMACHERGPLGCTGRVEWRKRLGVEPSPPAKRGATDFEDREGHRAPFASGAILSPDERVPTLTPWMASRTSMNMECERTTPPPPNGREWKRQKQSGPGPLDSSSGAGYGWRTSSLRLVESHQPADPLRTLPA